MNTPSQLDSFPHCQPLDTKTLTEQLELVQEIRTRAANVLHSYQLICEDQHEHLTIAEIDSNRDHISEPSYWRLESHLLIGTLLNHLLDSPSSLAAGQDILPSLTGVEQADWKRVSNRTRRLLNSLGYSSRVIQELRGKINNQEYRKAEVESLKPIVAFREVQSLAKILRKKHGSQTQAMQRTHQGESIAARTRSKTAARRGAKSSAAK